MVGIDKAKKNYDISVALGKVVLIPKLADGETHMIPAAQVWAHKKGARLKLVGYVYSDLHVKQICFAEIHNSEVASATYLLPVTYTIVANDTIANTIIRLLFRPDRQVIVDDRKSLIKGIVKKLIEAALNKGDSNVQITMSTNGRNGTNFNEFVKATIREIIYLYASGCKGMHSDNTNSDVVYEVLRYSVASVVGMCTDYSTIGVGSIILYEELPDVAVLPAHPIIVDVSGEINKRDLGK